MNKLNSNYWDDIKFTSNYYPQDKYIVFDQYNGGFSNVRMCYEIACVLAYALNRVLVLPKPSHIYLLESPNLQLSTFFDINNIVVSHIDYDEFIKTNSLDDAYSINNEAHLTMYKVDESTTPEYFVGKVISLNELEHERILYFPKNLFGNFYNVIQSSRMKELCRYVGKHLHYKEQCFLDATHCINRLGDLNYNAIHVRRGDFNQGWTQNAVCLPAESILKNIEEILPHGSKLYIATDETDKTFFDPFKDKYEIYFYNDVKVNDISKDFIGITEQIICSRAKTFIGSFASTFSSYITRLRGYMSDVHDKRYITFSTSYDMQLKSINLYRGIFVREYSTGWEF